MTENVLPTVARTMRSGGAMVNHLRVACHCQKDVMLGAAVVGTAVVPLSSTTLDAVALFNSNDFVSLPRCHELVTYEVLDDNATVANITTITTTTGCCCCCKFPSITYDTSPIGLRHTNVIHYVASNNKSTLVHHV